MTAKYEKPALQRFGTFRELTLVGWNTITDGSTFLGVTGNNCTTFDPTIGTGGAFVGCTS